MINEINELIPHAHTKLGNEFPITSITDLVCLALLNIRCMTIEQSLNLGYKNYDTAQKCLKLLTDEKKSFITHEYFSTNNNRHVAYFLSHNGFQHAYSLKNDYLYSNYSNIKEKYPNISDVKLKPGALSHATKVNDIYFALLKSPHIKNFNWYDEKNCIVTNSNGTPVLRNDAKFIVNDNTFLVEQDMGTESQGIIQKKFTQIADYISSLSDMPSIVFQISLSNLINPRRKKVLFNKPSSRNIKYIQKKIEELKMLYKIFKEKNINSIQDIKNEINDLQSLLNNDSMLIYISKKEIAKLKTKKKILESIVTSDPISIPTIESLKDEINMYTQTLNPLKNSTVKDFLKPKYEERKNIIKGIALDNSKKDSKSIYNLMLNGLDLYVGSNEEICNLFSNNILNPNGYKEILIEYICKILKSKTDLSLLKVVNKSSKTFLHNHQEFKINNHYRFVFEGEQGTNIFIEDLVCNCGAFARFDKMINVIDSDFGNKDNYYAFYFIVDSFNTAKKYWSTYNLRRFMECENMHIFFTDIDTLLNEEAKCYQIGRNENKIT